jgi:protein-S-isoprenylcysteine O-methyltransferase Ste14
LHLDDLASNGEKGASMANADPASPGAEERLGTAGPPEGSDNAHVLIRPPIALALAVAGALAATWLYPLPFLPAFVRAGWLGAALFALGLLLAGWSIRTMRRAGTRFETDRPSTRIVTTGPYRFVRNPIYVGMFLVLAALAIGVDSLWPLIALAPFHLVIRYGVVAREEAYLERKFGGAYLEYKARVRRWGLV